MNDTIYVGDLNETSRMIAQVVVDRLRWGLKVNGDWPKDDNRDWTHEAFEEVLDATIYLARDEVKRRGGARVAPNDQPLDEQGAT